MENWKTKKAIGVLPDSNWGGLVVLDIEHGIDDIVETCFDYGNGRIHHSKAKIRYTASGEPYFIKFGKRYHFNDIMRV